MSLQASAIFEVNPMLRGWRALAWSLAAPVRVYLRRFPFPRGKGLLLRSLILPILPREGRFDVRLPGGAILPFGYRERLGQGFLLRGEFESSELLSAIEAARPGTVAVDVGANVGLFTLALATRVGLKGCVIAIDPLEENVARIEAGASLNRLGNVRTACCAAGSSEPGTMQLYLAADSAFTSSEKPKEGGTGVGTRTVAQRTLDSLWRSNGSPLVTFVKIDVEGAEFSVLQGARDLLSICAPVLLVEANTSERLDSIRKLLGVHGYVLRRPTGFEPWNFLFVKAGAANEGYEQNRV